MPIDRLKHYPVTEKAAKKALKALDEAIDQLYLTGPEFRYELAPAIQRAEEARFWLREFLAPIPDDTVMLGASG